MTSQRYLRFTLLLACLTVVGLTGCQSAPSSGAYFRPEPVASGMGMVYVYRVDGAGGSELEVVVDGTSRAFIRRGEYVALPVEPGERFIRVQAESSAVRSVSVAPGESRFLEAVVARWSGRLSLDVPGIEAGRERIVRAKQVEPIE